MNRSAPRAQSRIDAAAAAPASTAPASASRIQVEGSHRIASRGQPPAHRPAHRPQPDEADPRAHPTPPGAPLRRPPIVPSPTKPIGRVIRRPLARRSAVGSTSRARVSRSAGSPAPSGAPLCWPPIVPCPTNSIRGPTRREPDAVSMPSMAAESSSPSGAAQCSRASLKGYAERTSAPVSVMRTCSSSFTASGRPAGATKPSTHRTMPGSTTPS